MFSNHNIWYFLFLIQLKLKENNKYSPRYRGSKFLNFKPPIQGGVTLEAFLAAYSLINSVVKQSSHQWRFTIAEVCILLSNFRLMVSLGNLGNSQIQQRNFPENAIITTVKEAQFQSSMKNSTRFERHTKFFNKFSPSSFTTYKNKYRSNIKISQKRLFYSSIWNIVHSSFFFKSENFHKLEIGTKGNIGMMRSRIVKK